MPQKEIGRFMNVFKNYLHLSKFKIAVLVILTTMLGYLLADFQNFSPQIFSLLIIGVYLVSSGSFVLNQVSESSLDSKMDRTKNRPIPTGKVSHKQGMILGLALISLGLAVFSFIHLLLVFLSLITCILYNFFYTLKWKKTFPIAGVFLGAIPGAMPVVIGWTAQTGSLLSIQCGYLFLIMFLWQMPHFWSLAFHYKNDYAKAKIPVLPLVGGVDQTLFYIGLYLLSYLGLALIAPLFFKAGAVYFIFAVPICLKIILEYYLFCLKKKWLAFFIWMNLSLLIFLSALLFDVWAVSYLFER